MPFTSRTLEPTLGAAEPEYRAHFLPADIAQFRSTVLAVLVLAVVAVVAEVSLGAAPPLSVTVATRGYLLAISLATLAVLARIREPAALDRLVAVFALAAIAQFLVLVASRPGTPIDGVGMAIVTLAIYLLVPSPLPYRLGPALVFGVGYAVVAGLLRHEAPRWFVAYAAAALSLHGIGAWMSARVHTSRRQEYQARESLRAALAERDALIQELGHTRQMAALGRLAAGVAHDFNNILNATLAPLELLGTEPALSELQKSDVHVVRDAVSRGRDLTQQLLAFSRHQPITPRVGSLNDLIIDTHRLLARTLGPGVRIELTLADDLWSIRADPGQIRQLVLNLAINARDAMSGDGVLRVTTRNATAPPGASHGPGGPPDGQHVVLSVSDTGTGMDADTLARIFEPFFTTKSDGVGIGLGLATVHGIVEQSGGRIQVRSEVGTGSTFEVYFPAVTDAAVPGA